MRFDVILSQMSVHSSALVIWLLVADWCLYLQVIHTPVTTQSGEGLPLIYSTPSSLHTLTSAGAQIILASPINAPIEAQSQQPQNKQPVLAIRKLALK